MQKFKPCLGTTVIRLEGSKRDQLAFLADIPCRSFSLIERPSGQTLVFEVTTMVGDRIRSYQLTVLPPPSFKLFRFSALELASLFDFARVLACSDYKPIKIF